MNWLRKFRISQFDLVEEIEVEIEQISFYWLHKMKHIFPPRNVKFAHEHERALNIHKYSKNRVSWKPFSKPTVGFSKKKAQNNRNNNKMGNKRRKKWTIKVNKISEKRGKKETEARANCFRIIYSTQSHWSYSNLRKTRARSSALARFSLQLYTIWMFHDRHITMCSVLYSRTHSHRLMR